MDSFWGELILVAGESGVKNENTGALQHALCLCSMSIVIVGPAGFGVVLKVFPKPFIWIDPFLRGYML